jgi:hypothetical protein
MVRDADVVLGGAWSMSRFLVEMFVFFHRIQVKVQPPTKFPPLRLRIGSYKNSKEAEAPQSAFNC